MYYNPFMKFYLILAISIFAVSCGSTVISNNVNNADTTNDNVAETKTADKFCEPYVYERLRNYFDLREIKADQIINNLHSLGAWKTQTRKVTIGKHTVEWIDRFGKEISDSETVIKINGDLIIPKDKESINLADDDLRIKMDYADE